MKDGSDHMLWPTPNFVWAHWVFERHRCAMCNDQLCEFTDISVGDEWKPVPREDKDGWCYVMTRTPEGDRWVALLEKAGILKLEETTEGEIYRGNYATLIFKKRGNRAFQELRMPVSGMSRRAVSKPATAAGAAKPPPRCRQ